MDSAMVYRGMDIGTAKPSRGYSGSAIPTPGGHPRPGPALFRSRLRGRRRRRGARALAAGRLPVLVGGTMLYLRAFREGLADLPTADPAVRADIAG
jgi:tRNA dimethylallyltransferase